MFYQIAKSMMDIGNFTDKDKRPHTVSDLIEQELICAKNYALVSLESSMKDVAKAMLDNPRVPIALLYKSTPDEPDQIVGGLTSTYIIRNIMAGVNVYDAQPKDLMSPNVVTINETESVKDMMNMLYGASREFSGELHLPIVIDTNGNYRGFITPTEFENVEAILRLSSTCCRGNSLSV